MPASSPRITVVVPVFNKRALLEPTLEALFRAAERRDDVEVVLVDNGSTDGAFDLVQAHAGRAVVHQMRGTISALRNWGARRGRGELLSFIDSDVVVPEDYFDRLVAVFAEGRARAVGCEYHLPDHPAVIERVWHELTVREDDAFRHYLNAGNFAITRALFERVGGFPEHLVTGEDVELCAAVRASGEPIYQSQALAAQHLGNAKTVGAFYRRLRWHAQGISDGRRVNLSQKPTIMMLVNVGLLALALLVAVLPLPLSGAARVGVSAALLLFVPLLTYAFRVAQVRRLVNLPVALLLVELFYAARFAAMVDALRTMRRNRRVTGPKGRSAATQDA
ncbi:glycosyl transferase family 2 [Gemmatirosa kalamazoonensis]|uniref:Glycosyl transferase family 2 n=1 Tax=Gemmatirosa kalamazoonensis TaxID=861299 RepID=W0RFY2_9BACT|nr:glycosyltransferase [Gemmatirosa kalamazoonensis]AHG90024.1 glycosyl transferase family 2 [Gemmatirosa kalamazoonensis]